MAILHVLQFSLPEISSGYTLRSHAILREQQQLGMDPIAVTSPRHPSQSDSDVDGIHYCRSGAETSQAVWLRDLGRVRRLARRICEIAQERGDVALLHAHSPVLCGMAALRAGRKLKLPVVYEVRGIWEDAMLQGSPYRRWLPRYQLARAFETRVCKRAQALITISRGLQKEFVARGVPENLVHVVPNGVDGAFFTHGESAANLREEMGLGAGPVILYLGALRAYEGIALLVASVEKVRQSFPGLRLVIVGAGESAQSLVEQVSTMAESVRVLPSVPHAETRHFYAAADVVVYPRLSTRATELVTPLKPLEAMAMGKAIVASDVGGLRELLTDRETARLFPAGSTEALAGAISDLLADPSERERLGEAARCTAERYDWRRVVSRYVYIYRSVGVTED